MAVGLLRYANENKFEDGNVMGKRKDISGQRYGRLTVIRDVGVRSGQRILLCKCDCGVEKEIMYCNLAGSTRSCGCLKATFAIKGSGIRTGTRLYRIYNHMKRRCYSPNEKVYSYYGGRGITVCDEWLADFEVFKSWALDSGYREDLEIDRIDNDGNYEPSNCRWATRKEQMNNRSGNHVISHEGETHTLTEWAEKVGISPATLSGRVNKNGYSYERALTEPVEVTYEINGEAHTMMEWSKILGIKFSIVSNRVSRGMTVVDALTKPVKKAARDYAYTFNGETHSLPEWAKITGIPLSTLHNRVRYKWPIERMLTEPKNK